MNEVSGSVVTRDLQDGRSSPVNDAARPPLWETVPFERQELPRGCGAACLAMVYEWLRRPEPQLQIWPRIAHGNPFGRIASITHLMARDAVRHGFSAVAVQARDKLESLRACGREGIPAILSIRLALEEQAGHYVVCLGERGDRFVLHDPLTGPRRDVARQDLLALWATPAQPSEVTGEILIAIGARDTEEAVCNHCLAPVPATVPCPRCSAPVGLRPLAAIGCMTATCTARRAARVCCPECDMLWEPSGAGMVPVADLGRVFGALDKFAAATVGLAGAHPDLSRLISQLSGLRSRLADAVTGEMVARARMNEQREAAKAQIAADIAVVRARSPAPLPPGTIELDPLALGEALLARLAE